MKAALKLRDFYARSVEDSHYVIRNLYKVGSTYFGINLDRDDEIEKIICAIIGNNH